jgi:hypothetical protein
MTGGRSAPAARWRAAIDLELAVPFARLSLTPGERLTLTFRLFSASAAPLARYPADSSLELTVPGDAFEAENWSA